MQIAWPVFVYEPLGFHTCRPSTFLLPRFSKYNRQQYNGYILSLTTSDHCTRYHSIFSLKETISQTSRNL